MAERIRIFICYKKMLLRSDGDQWVRQKNAEAEIFHYLLSTHSSYEPWLDDAGLAAGMAWETEIYRHVISSDVLVVLIGPGTSESEWVRREIALAQAVGVSVVPIGFDLDESGLIEELKRLSIANLHAVTTRNIRLDRGEALLAELRGALQRACAATRARQRAMAELPLRRRVPAKAPDSQKALTFRLLPESEQLELHVTSGDISRIRNIDVIVNSENDYMQMARFHEGDTVSSIVRRRGARVTAGRYQDTIQQELDWMLRERGRPVQAGEAFATSAGGPDSELARVNKARAVIHVATVQTVAAERRLIAFKNPQLIESSVAAVMLQMADINRASGIFSPPGSDQRTDQETRATAGHAELRRIIFPLLGGGQGGASPAEVIGPMIDGILGFVSDSDNQALAQVMRDIYVLAYTEEELTIVATELRRRLT